MPGRTCNACNMEFDDDAEQKIHYRSDWHRYNLKRKVAGVPGVTEALFIARQTAMVEQKSDEVPMLYSCGVCGKGYRSAKAYDQHLKSRNHIVLASQRVGNEEQDKPVIKPLPRRPENKSVQRRCRIDEESEDEWVEVDSDEELAAEADRSLTKMNVDESAEDEVMEEDDAEDEVDPLWCFMCDKVHKTVESCMVHLHKKHGFFIPDIEYLKDPEGLLTYLSLKVKRDLVCLYCTELCHPFSTWEAVRKHMEAKSHCKVRYGDGGDDEDAELEEFYDYSSSYVDEACGQIIVSDEKDNTVEISGGSELVITKKGSENRLTTRTLGSREYLRYYRQKPRPSSSANANIIASLASRYKNMGLTTVQSKEHIVRMKVLREMNQRGESMRTKIAMKNNVIRNLPNNVPY